MNKMLKFIKNKKGFTIIEIAVALTVLAVIILAVYTLLISGYNSVKQGSKKINIRQNIRTVEKLLNKELRNATCIEFGVNNNCGDNPFTFTLDTDNNDTYYLRQNGNVITDKIFTDINIEIISNNILNFTLELKNTDNNYKIRILLNNYSFESNNTYDFKNNTLYYVND